MTLLLALSMPAQATVPERCADIPLPKSYEGRTQRDFMQNYYALGTSLSPVHGPIPHKPGHGAIGLGLDVLPPLSCARQRNRRRAPNTDNDGDGIDDLVDTYQDTNKSPIVPRLRATFSFPKIGEVVPYGGIAYLPPVAVGGQETVLVSVEAGAGMKLGEGMQAGLRFHATQQKTTAEIVTPITENFAVRDDLFSASTFGIDGMFGVRAGPVVPYAALGLTDASTVLLIGDDGNVPNNLHPYLGPTMSLGIDGLAAERFRFGAEFYAAPGGHWQQKDARTSTLDGFGRYGRLYTARTRMAVEF